MILAVYVPEPNNNGVFIGLPYNQVVDPSRTHSSKEANQQERHPVTCAHMRDLNLVRLITVVCRLCATIQLLKYPTKQ